jgi:hypothetical protein
MMPATSVGSRMHCSGLGWLTVLARDRDPILHACSNTIGPSASRCSLSRMPYPSTSQQSLQRCLAPFERVASEVVPVQLDEVERIE